MSPVFKKGVKQSRYQFWNLGRVIYTEFDAFMIHVLEIISICFLNFTQKKIKGNHTGIFYACILNVPVHHAIGTYVHFIIIFHNNCWRIYFVMFFKTNLPIPIMEQTKYANNSRTSHWNHLQCIYFTGSWDTISVLIILISYR